MIGSTWFSTHAENSNGGLAKPTAEGSPALSDKAREQFMKAAELVKNTIINHPAPALAAALATGVVLGWLIKRR